MYPSAGEVHKPPLGLHHQQTLQLQHNLVLSQVRSGCIHAEPYFKNYEYVLRFLEITLKFLGIKMNLNKDMI